MLSLLPFLLHRLDGLFMKLLHVLDFTDAFCTLRGFLLVVSPAPERLSRATGEEKEKEQATSRKVKIELRKKKAAQIKKVPSIREDNRYIQEMGKHWEEGNK